MRLQAVAARARSGVIASLVCGSKKVERRGSTDRRTGDPGPLDVRGSTLARKTARRSLARSANSPSSSCSLAAIVSSVSTGGASIMNSTLTSDPSSSVTSARTVIVGGSEPVHTAASSKSAGRIPRSAFAEETTPPLRSPACPRRRRRPRTQRGQELVPRRRDPRRDRRWTGGLGRRPGRPRGARNRG